MKAINYEAPAGLWKEFFGEIALASWRTCAA
jgi:hypothetical protein